MKLLAEIAWLAGLLLLYVAFGLALVAFWVFYPLVLSGGLP